jgi:hypothetical protein
MSGQRAGVSSPDPRQKAKSKKQKVKSQKLKAKSSKLKSGVEAESQRAQART